MEFIIENLTPEEIDIMESSTIFWCPDDVGSTRRDIVVFSEEDRDAALKLIGRK